METAKQEENYVMCSGKQERYDKRLIKKIVQEVEAGLPRKQAKRIYKMGASTLDDWMNRYGSEHYHQQLKRRSYTKLQKRTIVTAIEQGRMSIAEARTAYNIKTEKTIRGWILRFKEEKVDLCIETQPQMAKQKSPDKQALEKALQEAELKIKALNTLIDVAEDQLKIDIRKKSGAKQS
ncbi:hypothetical protein MQE36_07915 [Zhouia spongiae]|uniref:Transposase n=1 Tax=Zhouia spongiae TaxID=2202721 RepID=A0ABY3YR14_9FLAO|nr:hypothetical protein [Zhouia spongiae]UNZ00258.1 hypothetical protein MQE36_07915 [Zhouia spongiae]